ncbi:MAG: CsbD family protein [Chthoniobacterales bacterium]|nr:CsbD family protein [Chthoniobacterales bacterium]
MNEDRIEGAVTTMGGRAQKDLGDLTGDRKLQSDGLADQARGTGQNMFGGAQDALRSALDQAPPQVRETADRAIAAARKSPILATLAVGAAGLIFAKIFRDTARGSGRS